MARVAEVKIQLSLTSDVYHRSAPDDEKPHLRISTTLLSPSLVTLELIGEFDTQTILEDWFRNQHFEFVDIATGESVINTNPFPGTCDPHSELYQDDVVELYASTPHVASRLLEDVDPGGDPFRQLEVGHQYRIKLKPQRIRGYERSIAELFGGKRHLSRDELLPMAIEAVLASEDELILKIEE